MAPLPNSIDASGKPITGLLDLTVARLRRDLAGCKVLRHDLSNTRDGDPKVKNNAGMIAVRYSASNAHYLSQQAILQANEELERRVERLFGSDRVAKFQLRLSEDQPRVGVVGSLSDAFGQRLAGPRELAQPQRAGADLFQGGGTFDFVVDVPRTCQWRILAPTL